jgi:hypothetical protein
MPHDLDADFIALQAALPGEYSLDREIGRGGMGVVYLAREVRLARPVAIKVLPPTLATRPGLRDAFLGEAQLAARLTHPNIVPVYMMEDLDGQLVVFDRVSDALTSDVRRQMADEIRATRAQAAVESLLRDVRTLPPASALEGEAERERDDDDTPVSGVPAASG